MRLVLVSHSATIGGAELVLLELVWGLVDRGVHVDVVLPGRGPLGPRLEAAGACTWEVPFEWWAAPRRSLARVARRSARNLVAACSIETLLGRLRPDAVLSNTLTIPSGALAAKALRVPHVWCLHEFGDKDHGLSFDIGLRNSVRLVSRLSARVIVNSRAMLEEFARYIPRDKLRLAYPGVDVPEELPAVPALPERPFRLVLVGIKAPSKGQEDAIRAVGLLRARERDVRLALVGHGSPEYVRRLARLAREVGAHDVIDFVDFTEDRYRHFQRSHVALMCSRSEAFGRVTVEAMKLGLPVIGTDRGATPELVRERGSGMLYPYGDASALAERIDRLYSDRELRERLGAGARDWARATFSVRRHADDVMGILAEIGVAAPGLHPRVTS